MPPMGYITSREAVELSGVSDNVVRKAIEQRVIPAKRLKSGVTIEALDVPALMMFSQLAPFALPVATKRLVRQWLRSHAGAEELALAEMLVVRMTADLEKARERAQRYVELRNQLVQSTPDIRDGEPVIRGSRVPIRGLAKQVEAGESLEVLREDYPHIPEEAFEFAVQWARANPRRGRPGPPRSAKRAAGRTMRASSSAR